MALTRNRKLLPINGLGLAISKPVSRQASSADQLNRSEQEARRSSYGYHERHTEKDGLKASESEVVCLAAVLCSPIAALAQTSELFSGEVIQGNSTVGPVFDSATGNTVFVRQPLGAPMPVKSNVNSMVPVYVVAYPLDSTITEENLQCLPTNCDHLNVLPFPAPNYETGDPAACQTWNGGAPCALLKGHIHLFGVASDGGDFSAQHFVKLLLFTPQAFAKCQASSTNCPFNTLVRTMAQMDALEASGDLTMPLDTPITVHISVVPERTYDLGTPTHISFP